jgi:hypothetical protein
MRDDKFVKSTLLGTMACLGASLEYSKQQNVALLAMMKEVLALRETVKALDPTFSNVLSQKRREKTKQMDSQFPQVAALPALLDEMKQELKGLQQIFSEQ